MDDNRNLIILFTNEYYNELVADGKPKDIFIDMRDFASQFALDYADFDTSILLRWYYDVPNNIGYADVYLREHPMFTDTREILRGGQLIYIRELILSNYPTIESFIDKYQTFLR